MVLISLFFLTYQSLMARQTSADSANLLKFQYHTNNDDSSLATLIDSASIKTDSTDAKISAPYWGANLFRKP